jgi:hypothetical protein
VAGSFKAHGHEVTIETLGLEWTATVFFHAMGNPAHAFVGRRGWLDRVRLGVVHYEHVAHPSDTSCNMKESSKIDTEEWPSG